MSAQILRYDPNIAKKNANASANRRPTQAPSEEPPIDLFKKRKVELVTLFTSKDLQKDYGRYTMVYDGRTFRKIARGSSESMETDKNELIRFLLDIVEAAKQDSAIRAFIEENPIHIPPHLKLASAA